MPVLYALTLKRLAVGFNSTREAWSGCRYGRHAEQDVLMKLKPRRKKKNRLEIDLLVIRVGKSGKLCNSKPCTHCRDYLKDNVPPGYKIRNIYYSNRKGEIECEKYADLIKSDDCYVSRRWRN